MSQIADRVISYVFKGSFANLTAGLAASGKSVGDFGGKLTALDAQGAKMRAGLTTLGGAAGKAGLVAGVGLAAVVAVTAKFESAMSRVGAATSASAGEMEDLRAAAIKLGADTIFSATEAADGITELGKAGISATDILGGGLKGALDLAAAGQISVAQAAETTAITLQQFSLDGSQATRVADTLAAGASKAVGDVGDMSQALQYVGPVAAQMGLSLEDTTGAIAELASAGILGSQAGTSLRGILTSLTSPSKMAANEMASLGINMYDAQGKFVGLDGIAGQLQSTMGGLAEADRDAALGRIFGNEQITAARILYAGGAEDVQKWTKQVTDSGFAAEQAAKLTDNLAGDVEQLKGALESALIGAGSGSQGPLRSLTQGLTSIIDKFNELPSSAKSATSALLAITAVTGGGLWFGSKVINGIASTKEALGQLGLTAGKSRTALAGLGKGVQLIAIIEGVKLLDNALAGLTNQRLEGDLNRNLQALANGEIVGNLDKMGDYVRSVNSSIAEGSGKIFGWLPGKTEFSEASDEIEKVDQVLAQLVEGGNADQAAAIMGKIRAQADEQGISVRETNKVFDQYTLALHNAAAMAGPVLGPSLDVATAAMDSAYQSGEEYVAQQKAVAEALEASRKAANDTATQFFNLGDSLNDSKVSLGDWIGELEKQAQALKNFRKNAEEAADKGLRQGLIAALREAGPEGAMRLDQLAGATEKEIRRANRAWKTGQDQIAAYTDEVGGVPKTASTTVNANAKPAVSVLTDVKGRMTALGKMVARVLVQANTDEARSKLAGIRSELASIKDKSIYVGVRGPGVSGMGPQLRAVGGFISGPGSGTSDSIPARLSNGEYVVKAAAVDRYGVAMFDNLNAQRFAKGGRVGFAKGGQVVGGDDPRYDAPDGKKAQVSYFKDFARDAKQALSGLKTASDAAAAAVNLETATRDSLQQSFDGLASAIAGLFSSDLFAQDGSNPFSRNGSSDPISVLLSDIANSQEFSGLFAGLQSRGLSGAALGAAAQGGSGALRTLSAYTPEQLTQFETLFNQREKLNASTGRQVAEAQFGVALAESNDLLSRANDALLAINASVRSQEKTVEQAGTLQEKATKALASSAAKGSRNKPRGRR